MISGHSGALAELRNPPTSSIQVLYNNQVKLYNNHVKLCQKFARFEKELRRLQEHDCHLNHFNNRRQRKSRSESPPRHMAEYRYRQRKLPRSDEGKILENRQFTTMSSAK